MRSVREESRAVVPFLHGDDDGNVMEPQMAANMEARTANSWLRPISTHGSELLPGEDHGAENGDENQDGGDLEGKQRVVKRVCEISVMLLTAPER